MKRALVLSATFLLAVATFADGPRRGDLLVASGSRTESFLDHHDAGGQFVARLSAKPEDDFGDAGAVIMEGRTRLFIEKRGRIRRLNEDGTLGEPFGPQFPYVLGFTVDAADNIYVSADIPNRYFGSGLIKLDPNGNVLRQYLDVSPGYAFDLDADQCTLYYMRSDMTSWGDVVESWQVLARYDVCTDAPLPDVLSRRGQYLTIRDTVFSLRVVKGGVLWSTMDTLEHRDFDGRLINQYRGTPYDFFRLALDPSGDTFWTGMGGLFRHFDLATMQEIAPPATGPHYVHWINVVDGWRASRRPVPRQRDTRGPRVLP